jgi:hypothetical protein
MNRKDSNDCVVIYTITDLKLEYLSQSSLHQASPLRSVVDQTLRADRAGLGGDVVVGCSRAGNTFVTVPDWKIIRALNALLSVEERSILSAGNFSRWGRSSYFNCTASALQGS